VARLLGFTTLAQGCGTALDLLLLLDQAKRRLGVLGARTLGGLPLKPIHKLLTIPILQFPSELVEPHDVFIKLVIQL
jgi:hypothetical protein